MKLAFAPSQAHVLASALNTAWALIPTWTTRSLIVCATTDQRVEPHEDCSGQWRTYHDEIRRTSKVAQLQLARVGV